MRTQVTELRPQRNQLRAQDAAAAPSRVGSRLYAVEEMTVGTLVNRVSEIALGLTTESFSSEERSAAFSIRGAAERIDRGEAVMVLADPREMLGSARDVVAQLGEIERRVAERGIGR